MSGRTHLDVFFRRFSVDSVERFEELLKEDVLARALVIRRQVVFHRFAHIPVQLHDDLFCELSHLSRVVLTCCRAELHHVVERQSFRFVLTTTTTTRSSMTQSDRVVFSESDVTRTRVAVRVVCRGGRRVRID